MPVKIKSLFLSFWDQKGGFKPQKQPLCLCNLWKLKMLFRIDPILKKLLHSPLFWDIEASQIDTDRNSRFIIERVISRGTLNDWKTILAFYGKEKIRKEVLLIRSIDHKTLCYLSVFFNIKESDFRCCS